MTTDQNTAPLDLDGLERLKRLRGQARNGTAVSDPNEWEADELDAIIVAHEALISQAREAERMRGWQPIETAPRDGTHIIGYDHGVVSIVWWELDEPEWVDWQNEEDSEPAPTHWMPLPDAPATGGGE